MFGLLLATLFGGGALVYAISSSSPAAVVVAADASRWLLALGVDAEFGEPLSGEVYRNGASWAWKLRGYSGAEPTLGGALRATARAALEHFPNPNASQPLYIRRADDAVIGAVEPTSDGTGWGWVLRANGVDSGASSTQRGVAVLELVAAIERATR